MKKNVVLAALAALSMLFCSEGLASSLAIKDARATASYWTERNPAGEAEWMTKDEIAAANREMRAKSKSLTDLMSYPGSISGVQLNEMIHDAQQSFRGKATPGKHYDKGGAPISQEDFDRDRGNCNLEAIPSQVDVRYGVITARADMRLLPTAKYYYDDPSFQHYDDLQGTALDPCEPVLVLHTSADGAFAFALGRYYMGWVSLGSVAFADREAWEKYVSPKDFLVVAANKKKIHVGGAWEVLFQMGSIIPLKSSALPNGTYQAVLPVEVNGHLSEAEVNVWPDDTVHLGFLPCTSNNFVRQSMKFLGDAYGWGGMEESVDCSSFVQDVYRSMGLEIPRDADQQELAMPHSVSLDGLGTAARYRNVGEAPVGALLFKPGHVMLYLGKDANGIPLAIHSASSYFTFPGGKREKHYVRQVLVSDLAYQNSKGVKTIDGMTSIGSCRK